MRSADFEREIEHAYSIGCPILPLLIDISREEFEKLAPSWCRMLGASPIIEYRRTEPLREILDRIAAAARDARNRHRRIDGRRIRSSRRADAPARSG